MKNLVEYPQAVAGRFESRFLEVPDPVLITAMRERLEAVGVEFRFESRVVGLCKSPDGSRVTGVKLMNGEQVEGHAVVLATGHSARDVFEFLKEAGVRLEAKPFALGVRIEHPQPIINRIQYGSSAGHPKLPSAAYHLIDSRSQKAHQGSSVFSFCMCPGGTVVAATSEAGRVVTNGMSQYSRNERNANAGIVVGINPEQDFPGGPLAGVELQERIEAQAYVLGGSDYTSLAFDWEGRRGFATFMENFASYAGAAYAAALSQRAQAPS